MYDGCTDPMKYVNKRFVITPTKQFEDKRLWNEGLWESEHVLDAAQRTHNILDASYQKFGLINITSESKYLISDKQVITYTVLTKHELIFVVILGTWKAKPADI